MADAEPGYCPRCGTERMPGMRFCARCGLDFDGAPAEADMPAPTAPAHVYPEPATTRALLPTPVIAVAAILFVGLLLYFGVFGGRTPAGGPATTTPPPGTQPSAAASAAATPLLVGLTIISPADGAVVATNKVLVIGTAPPGLTITQDISMGLDRHTPVDGTGHWAMEMQLAEGDNQMTFRIGDDKSTARTIHVVYQPPAAS